MMSLPMLFAMVAAAQPAPPAPPLSRIRHETGYLGDAGEENGGWIRFMHSKMRYRFPANARDRDTLIQVLGAAMQRNVSIRVRYDATGGRPAAAGGYVEYPLCSVSVANGASFGDEAANCPAGPAPALPPGHAALARGLAEVTLAPEAARASLAAALAVATLEPSLRIIALEARGEATEILNDRLPWAEADYDRITFDGLADYRAWAAAAPDDPEALYAVARLLADLGGYPEALAVYRAIGRRWPQEAFNVAIRTGALFRRQSRYAEALAVLDAFVAQAGVMEGMRYRYHRAWTLQLLDRPAEALAEINRGFETQPDYPFAYLIRSCANAKLGRLQEALADQERGLELLDGFARDSNNFNEELQVGRGHVAALRRLVAAGSRQATDLPCQGYWRRDIRSRPRSPLLGPAAG